MKRKRGGQLQRKVNIRWSHNFAYAIGLIASDGCLQKDRGRIVLKAADKELVANFKTALKSKNTIASTPGRRRMHYQIQIGDKVFYKFLNRIGLTSAKSKTIQAVQVPDCYFGDFLRGVFDGDGNFYSCYDKRWPNSLVYQISFASASYAFVIWLQEQLCRLYGVKGFIRPGKGVFNLRYVKRDTRKLAAAMYRRPDCLCLTRKYVKMVNVFKQDIAAVAQW